jgi:molybdopterin/thiamine biosynthesis adenylyltransferase
MKTSVDERLAAELQKSARKISLPGGGPIWIIGEEASKQLADSSGVPLGRVYAAAAGGGIFPERFLRNARSMSTEDQARLFDRRIAVVGLGGLGGVLVEILARIGIGAMTLIDGDRFEESNLNRQVLSTVDTIGAAKADAAAERVRAINPAVALTVCGEFFDEAGAEALLSGADLVVDCLDSIPVRFELEAAAGRAGLPLISAAVAGAAGHVTTIFPGDPGLALIYGKAEASAKKGSEAELGCLPHAVALLASLEASEAVKVVLEKHTLLRNRLVVVDLFENIFEVVDMS